MLLISSVIKFKIVFRRYYQLAITVSKAVSMVNLDRISDSVFVHVKGETRANIAFIDLGDFIVAVDSGMFPTVAEELRRQIERIRGKRIRYLIITHYHGDHVFGNQAYEDCEIIASKKTYEIMAKRLENEWSPEKLKEYISRNPELAEKLKGLRIVLPTTTFSSKYVIGKDNNVIEVYEADGHCDGSVFVYFPKEKVLVAGDLYFAKMWPYGGDPTVDPYKWVAALEKMLEPGVNIVVPGHGPVTSKEDLAEYLNFMKMLVRKIEEYVDQGITIDKIMKMEDILSLGPTPKSDNEKYFQRATIEKFYEKIKTLRSQEK